MPLNDVIKKRLKPYTVKKVATRTKVGTRFVETPAGDVSISFCILPISKNDLAMFEDGTTMTGKIKLYTAEDVDTSLYKGTVSYEGNEYKINGDTSRNVYGGFSIYFASMERDK